DKVFLREQNIEGTYACLSHCWGSQGPALQLTQESMNLFMTGVARCQLPNTFRDAVEICSNLNISYLWIDALCIIQNDEGDWRDAVSAMASIYESAYITIAATASDGSEGGCFQSAFGQHEVHKLGNTGLFALKMPPRFPAKSSVTGESNLIDWPLLTRGWVCQERRLSSRMVHFAKHQLVWECETVTRSEYGDEDWQSESNMTVAHNPVKALHLDSKSGWKEFVETYSALKFTKTTDRLPALAGIVTREMRRRVDDVYVAGMWKSTLLDDLASYSLTESPRAHGVPTWSWACYLGHVSWLSPLAKRTAELLHLDLTYDGPAQMGTVHGAGIRIRGPTLSLAAQSFHTYEYGWVDLLQNEFWSCYLEPRGSFGAQHRLGGDDKFLVLLLSADHENPSRFTTYIGCAILLQETTTGKFEKIGTVKVYLKMHIDPDDGKWRAALEAILDFFTVREVEII
ncbi:heterokaryon incompatibility protein-domain-containing protein, partial [Paraphoma chrysanthemicola]